MPRLTELPPLEPAAPTRARRGPQQAALEVRASAIDGQGAFAAEPITARRKIGEVRGEPVSTQEAQRRSKGVGRIMMIAVSERRAIDASQSTDALRFANHSCRPNAVLKLNQGRVEFYALRDIGVGEEITVNYGATHHRGRMQCHCGVAGCVGLI
ncbi:MAG TPA: SET domain-containing protein-lysine N-methyltransferase [Rhizobacter sp.]|nr:SET domain-containing protein-lysine N-methyltransferase [Rhizobacter sp.]